MRNESGDKIVDWLMDVMNNKALPLDTRMSALDKLVRCAKRKPAQTVQDALGLKH